MQRESWPAGTLNCSGSSGSDADSAQTLVNILLHGSYLRFSYHQWHAKITLPYASTTLHVCGHTEPAIPWHPRWFRRATVVLRPNSLTIHLSTAATYCRLVRDWKCLSTVSSGTPSTAGSLSGATRTIRHPCVRTVNTSAYRRRLGTFLAYSSANSRISSMSGCMSKPCSPGSSMAARPTERCHANQSRVFHVVSRASATRRDLFVGSGGVLLGGQLPQPAIAADSDTAAPVAPGRTIPKRALTAGLDVSEVCCLTSTPELASVVSRARFCTCRVLAVLSDRQAAHVAQEILHDKPCNRSKQCNMEWHASRAGHGTGWGKQTPDAFSIRDSLPYRLVSHRNVCFQQIVERVEQRTCSMDAAHPWPATESSEQPPACRNTGDQRQLATLRWPQGDLV